MAPGSGASSSGKSGAVRRIRIVIAVLLALPVAQGGQAHAQGYVLPGASCPSDSPPTAHLAGLPDVLIHGRWHWFTVRTTSRVEAGYDVAMADAAGTVFYSTTGWHPRQDGALGIRSDPGDGPLTVAVAYEEPLNPPCRRVISKTMTSVNGRPMPAPAVSARYEEARFTIRHRPDCRRDYAPSPLRAQVKVVGASRWTVVRSPDQYDGWAKGARGRLFDLETSGRMLTFVPKTPRRDAVDFFRYRMRVNGRTVASGRIRVRTSHYVEEQVFAYDRSGATNDEYWNYCVNEGKTVWMQDGNPYCISPAFTYRAVHLVKPSS